VDYSGGSKLDARGLKGGPRLHNRKNKLLRHTFSNLVEGVGVEEVAGYVADVSGLAYHLVVHFSHFVVGDFPG
jgi:hypothetical protein